MALKFLNKKGWHTGSLRNIENVWKAEQKRDAEDKKLDELRKQIHEERERSEFRQLQEQAGLVPKQERLDFLYESGLAVGKGSSEGFKALEALPKAETDAAPSEKQPSSAPGALFEEKPQSANDAWRKLHSDPLLLIRQREQEALARIKNNPVQMAMIQKSVNIKKHEGKDHKKSRHSSSKGPLDSKDGSIGGEEERGKRSRRHHTKHGDHLARGRSDSETDSSERKKRKKKHQHKSKPDRSESEAYSAERWNREKDHHKSKHERLPGTDHSQGRSDSNIDSSKRREIQKSRYRESKHRTSDSEADSSETRERRKRTHHKSSHEKSTETNLDRKEEAHNYRSQYNRHRKPAPKLTDEEKAARLREMQADAEVHEEQRWKRLKKASEDDALEENKAAAAAGKRNFLDAAHKSVYGAEAGGSSTIEESVRRQKFYLQGRSEGSERNAFRR